MTLEPPPDHPSLETLELRRALGGFATGVCVVTTTVPDGELGITVNSFTSVSLSPPLVLWCLDERSERWPVFAAAEQFSIHVLAAGDRHLAHRFAKGPANLDDQARRDLAHAVTRLDCVPHQRVQMGDHMVMVGRVTGFVSPGGPALTFHRGRYGAIGD